MKASILILFIFFFASCAENNPVEPVPDAPAVNGKWYGKAPEDGTNPITTLQLELVIVQHGDSLSGTGSYLNMIRFAVDVNGVVSYPHVSFNLKSEGYPATNFVGRFLPPDTLSGRLNGYVSVETPIKLVRQH